jgi:hypothetical protein
MGQMNFIESMGNRWWPIFGAVFLVSAIKRHKGLKLIGQVQNARLQTLGQLAPAAERNQLRDRIKINKSQ